MTFRVGQKVVTIKQPDPKQVARWPGSNWPVKDGVYTIRAINEWPADDGCGPPLVLLRFEEIDNKHLEGKISEIEPGFPAKYFVPEKASRKSRVSA